MAKNEWWRGAVVYQIYPRSFLDTDGDGVGDLNGIIEKLDYIESLGVDAVWISPFFKSPMKDYGYDVSDYRDIDPLFGTLEDCDRLIEEAHKRNLKLIFDLVLSHTSDQHVWFKESRQSRDNHKADWYVWADPKPDGSPPNNWLSFFGGPSWTYDVRRGQYYLNNFLPEQPDLNLWNPEVQDALIEATRFWLDRGIDGLRLDAIMCYFHGQDLKDNPVNANPAPSRFNVDFPTPHSMQDHVNDHIIPPGIEFSEKLRTLLNEYDDRMAVAEVGGDDGIMLSIRYTEDEKKLHTAYHFGLLAHDPLTPEFVRNNIVEFETKGKGSFSWPSWAFSNHDVVRAQTRWGLHDHEHSPEFAKFLIALLCSLRGTPFIYQGEELGLPDAHIDADRIQDPWGKFLYPLWQGRDGCRTPMPWDGDRPHAGFSISDDTWLPVDRRHFPLSVKQQRQDSNSTLNFTREFLKWRKDHTALIDGEIDFVDMHDSNILAMTRINDDQKLFCIYNFSADTVIADMSEIETETMAFSSSSVRLDNKELILPAFGFSFFTMK